MERSNISNEMKKLCRDARVAEENTNPRCLRKLCQDTQEEIYAELVKFAEQKYDRLVETEQEIYGWIKTSKYAPQEL